MRVSRCDLVAEREAVPNSPAYFAEGIKEVRSEVLSLFIPVYPDKSGTSRELVGSRTKERKGAGGGLGTQPQRSKGGMLCNSPASPPPSPSAGYSKNALGVFFCGNGLLVSVFASIFARTFNHAPTSLLLIKV